MLKLQIIEFHRVTKLLRLEGTFGDCSVQTPAQSRVNKNRLLMAVSSPVLNVSKDTDSTTFHGNLFQCSFILTIKTIFFFHLSRIFCIAVCTFCHLFFCLHGSEKSLLFILHTPLSRGPTFYFAFFVLTMHLQEPFLPPFRRSKSPRALACLSPSL